MTDLSNIDFDHLHSIDLADHAGEADDGHAPRNLILHEFSKISAEVGILYEFMRCYTAFLSDYVVSRHVPHEVVDSLVELKPDLAGVTPRACRPARLVLDERKQEPFTSTALINCQPPSIHVEQ